MRHQDLCEQLLQWLGQSRYSSHVGLQDQQYSQPEQTEKERHRIELPMLLTVQKTKKGKRKKENGINFESSGKDCR